MILVIEPFEVFRTFRGRVIPEYIWYVRNIASVEY